MPVRPQAWKLGEDGKRLECENGGPEAGTASVNATGYLQVHAPVVRVQVLRKIARTAMPRVAARDGT